LFWLNVLMRWLHVGAAVVGLGTTIAMRFAVLPALASLPNGAEVLDRIRPGVKRVIHSALGVLILSGFYNYIMVSIPAVRNAKKVGSPALQQALQQPSYHMLMGMKIILAIVLFVIAILLLKPVPAFHENRKTWLSVNTVIGLVILLLSAYLRRVWALQ